MRKKLLIFSVFATALFASCSDEETIISNDTTVDLEVAIEQIDFNPETAQPDSRFNDTSEGLYHGVFVTLDTEIHAKIWININNDGQYNATVVSNQGDRFKFVGKQVDTRTGSKVIFNGKNGSFDFDVTDIENPVASNVIISGKEAHISVVKDRAGQRAAVILGTFETDDDPANIISGTWDLITDGTPNPEAFNFPLLTEVCITVTNNGNVYSDTDFETFDYPCFFSLNDIAPVFLHEDPMTTPNGRNEFWAQDQSFVLGNATLTYWLGQSSGLVDNNGVSFADHGWFNNDFGNPATPGCNPIDGQKGVWFWNGRSGTSSFDDPFDVPMRAVENIDYEGFEQMLREVN